MPSRIRKKPNFNKYIARVKKSDSTLYSIIEFIIVGIIKRTQSGRDKDNKQFKRYSAQYGKTGTVNLTETGSMLQSIDRKKITNGVRLYFPNFTEARKAYHNHKTFKRPFFGVDKKQREQIAKRLGKFIVK